MSDFYVVILAFFWLLLAWYILSCSFILNLFMSLKYVSIRQHIAFLSYLTLASFNWDIRTIYVKCGYQQHQLHINLSFSYFFLFLFVFVSPFLFLDILWINWFYFIVFIDCVRAYTVHLSFYSVPSHDKAFHIQECYFKYFYFFFLTFVLWLCTLFYICCKTTQDG